MQAIANPEVMRVFTYKERGINHRRCTH